MKSSFISAFLVCWFIFIGESCKKDEADAKPDFDRTALVANIGNAIIIPAYQKLTVSVNALDVAVTTFNTAPSISNLTDLQNKFIEAYKAWQHCSPFEFGPADQAILNKNLNTFPVNTSKVNANIALAGNYDLEQLSNLDAKGFPAMDYMLFGIASDNASILSLYTTDNNANNRKQYLAALSSNIKTKSTNVLNAWLPTGGNYIDTFLKATGTDVGSALGQIINGLNYDLDLLKNYKVALPVGIVPSSGTQGGAGALPQKVEAYYSGISSQLIFLELTALQDIYLGRSDQGDGQGLDDYLVKINAQYNNGLLNDAINNQFAAALSAVQNLPDPLSKTIQNNPNLVTSSYSQLQQLLVLLKTDMPSSMGVLITFEDNDGD